MLELTEAMQAPACPRSARSTRTQDVVFDEPQPEPAAAARAAEPPRAARRRSRRCSRTGIMSSATAAAVDSAFNALAQTVLVQNAKTLEDLVKEMLRPMLQHWLDNNLPTLVERLVRAGDRARRARARLSASEPVRRFAACAREPQSQTPATRSAAIDEDRPARRRGRSPAQPPATPTVCPR